MKYRMYNKSVILNLSIKYDLKLNIVLIFSAAIITSSTYNNTYVYTFRNITFICIYCIYPIFKKPTSFKESSNIWNLHLVASLRP